MSVPTNDFIETRPGSVSKAVALITQSKPNSHPGSGAARQCRRGLIVFGYAVLVSLAVLSALLMWLVYCAWVTAHSRPREAANIIEASGRWFPFKGWRWPWPRGR
jgi:hypothetical protein